MNKLPPNIKLIILASLCAVVGLIGFYAYQTTDRSSKVQVSVTTLPGDALITLNGKEVGNGDTYLPTGDYKVSVTKSGFDSYSNTVHFARPTGVIDIALTPQSGDAQTWADQHAADYTAYEGRAGQRAEVKGLQFSTSHPIVSHLPYENFLFTIGYSSDPTDLSGNTIIVTVDASEGYRQAAINTIKQWGVNPADYNIIFRSYENPFAL